MNGQQTGDLLEQLLELLAPLSIGGANRYYLEKLLAQIGWDAQALSSAGGVVDPVENLGQKLGAVVKAVQELTESIETPPEDLAGAVAFFHNLSKLVTDIKGLSTDALGDLQLTPADAWEGLGADILSWAIPAHLRANYPQFYELAALFTIIESQPDVVAVTAQDGTQVRAATVWPQFDPAVLFRLLQDPAGFLNDAYVSGAELAETIDRLFPRLAALLSVFGIRSVFGVRPGIGPDFGDARDLAELMLTVYLGQDADDEPYGVTLTLEPDGAGGLGLVIVPFGSLDGSTYEFGDWVIDYALKDDNINGLAIRGDDVDVLPDTAEFKEIGFQATRARALDGPAILVGEPQGSYLRIDSVALSGNVVDDGSGNPTANFAATLGPGDLVISQLLDASWDEMALTTGAANDTTTISLRGLRVNAELVPGANLLFDLTLVFVGGALDVSRSRVSLKEPTAKDLALHGFSVTDEGVALDLGADAFKLGDLHVGWDRLTLGLAFDGAIQLDVDHLQLGYGHPGQVDVSASLGFLWGDVDVETVTLHRPQLEDLPITNVAWTREYLALEWVAADINALLGSTGVDVSLKESEAAGDLTVTLRILFGEGYADVREVRLDFRGESLSAFALPGFDLRLPPNTRATVLAGGPDVSGRTLSQIALALSLDSAEPVKLGSSFAWRDEEAPSQHHRELQNDGSEATEPLFQIDLTASAPRSIVVADFKPGEWPDLLTQVKVRLNGSEELVLPELDFVESETLGEIRWRTDPDFDTEVWSAALKFNGDLTFPFLTDGDSQFVRLHEPENRGVDLAERAVAFTLPITVFVGSLQLDTKVDVTLDLDSFAIKITHQDGLELKADKPELTGSLLGLTWRFRGMPTSDGRFAYFALLTQNNDYRIKQVEGCLLELDYDLVGADPISFDVRNFELSEKGIGLVATVVDRPVQLNGLDTKFRFSDSSFEIVESRIKAFTLTGSGPLPPALVGEATANIALQFEQVDGALRLVNGGAELKGSKTLDCPDTRFRFSIDAISLRFVDDGRYHLYFTLTGNAEFVPAATDDANGPLALLPGVKIELVDCPLTGDASVLAEHISFLVALPKPVSFDFLGCFGMEVRGIGFQPQAEVFGGDGAMLLSGQVKFAEGTGDATANEIDYHRLYIGLPEKGKYVPRLYMRDLPVALNTGEAFRLNGVVKFFDDKTTQGFSGEGTLQIQGLPTIAASFSFLRVRQDEHSSWLRAWFIYLEAQQISFMVPVVQFYLREVGLGFGYRYTLASIKAADEASDLRQLLRELRALSRTQGNLATLGAWAVDLERPNEDPRWTVVLRALISQSSAAKTPLDWDANAEKALKNAYLFDAVIALRSDLTFFMAVRAWINTTYAAFIEDPAIRGKPLFSGFVLLTPRQRRLLAQLSANPDGHLGSNPELPELVQSAIRGLQFSATLLVEPGLIHYELGWPNQLGWSGKIGPLDAEFTGGFILRVSDREFVMGSSFMARARLEIGAAIDLGFVGAEVKALARVGFGARYIGVLPTDSPADFAFYGAVGLEARLDLAFSFWIGLRINLGFKTINIRKDFRLSAAMNFTAGLEIGIIEGGAGVRGRGTLALSAMGHRLELSVNLSLDEDRVALARSRTERYLQMGLEATEVQAVPGLPAGGDEAPAFVPAALAAAPLDVDEPAYEFHIPRYILFVVRRPEKNKAYFLLLPSGEDEGFLPPPPPIEPNTEREKVLVQADDFELTLPDLGDGVTISQYDPASKRFMAWDQENRAWRANWNEILYKVDAEGNRTRAGDTPVHLWRELVGAYVLGAPDGQPFEIDGEIVEVPVGDPQNLVIKDRYEDERVHNPTAGAFEAAVRGAMEQFEASPFFKRDENYEYDKLLGAAFDEKTTIYSESGETENANVGEQQARQVRGAIIQDMIADLQDLAEADGALPENAVNASVAFQMGLVFEVSAPDGNYPEWLDGQGDDAPRIRVRREPNTSALEEREEEEDRKVRPFNTSATSFRHRSPIFDRVRNYSAANTIAIAWDLKWPAAGADVRSAAREPEEYLQHYHVRRRALDGSEGDHVFTVAPVQVLHRDATKGLVALRPRFQIVDQFNHETRAEQAALPLDGRKYLYTITPVDFEGNLGRPLTVIVTRKADQPPLTPTDAELVVTYHLPKDPQELATVSGSGSPLLYGPASVVVRWNDPVSDREYTVPTDKHYLIFRPGDILPIGSYGLDSVTARGSASALPTSNARPLPGDVRVTLSQGEPQETSAHRRAGFRHYAEMSQRDLADVGHGGPGAIWQARSWQVFIQAESLSGVRSALAPVKLLLRFKPAPDEVLAQPQVKAFEERQVPELEWIPHPTQLDLLPAEDMRALIGTAHVPMPTDPAQLIGDAQLASLRFMHQDAEDQPFVRHKPLFAPHPDHLRVLRFRWNQSPSGQLSGPTALYAGYRLLMLDADAHTTEDMHNAERLAASVRQMQEIQMLPAGDRWLSPGDTLATGQWEAWYPSQILRIAGGKAITIARGLDPEEAPPGPWYSWRESILVWPEWKGARETELHPALDLLVESLREEYTVDLQLGPPMQPVTLGAFLESTGPQSDPYGWGILQRLGLSVAFTLRPRKETENAGLGGHVLTGEELTEALQRHIEGVLQNAEEADLLREYLPHLYVELLYQPSRSVSLTAGATPDDSLLALTQLSLRPAVRQTQHYAVARLAGPGGTQLRIRIAEGGAARSFIVQSTSAATEGDARVRQVELDAGKEVEQVLQLPLSGATAFVLRGKGEDIDALLEDPAAMNVSFDLRQAPDYSLAGNDAQTAEAAFNEYFQLIQGSSPPRLDVIKSPHGMLEDKRTLCLKVLPAESDHRILEVAIEPFEEFSPTDVKAGQLAAYFTVDIASLAKRFEQADVDSAAHEQWGRFRRYLEMLNSPNPTVPQILVPTAAQRPADDDDKTKLFIEELLPDFLIWSRRFFTHGGAIRDTVTSAGPWLATAYPRTTSPAYVTPDVAGVLQYDHLLEDRWAHNYRFYIQPYSRYDLLWSSLLQSRFLFDQETLPDPLPESIEPDLGALDLVVDRTYPVDRPLVLRSGRLDKPGTSRTATPPGRTWEVIVAQHWEQTLGERNQTLARQLSFRHVAFALQRRFAEPMWIDALHVRHEDVGQSLIIDHVEGVRGDLPGPYDAPDHVDLVNLPHAGEEKDDDGGLHLALPTRIERFQQGALTLQWDTLPYYYEHRLLLVAHTTHQVSPITTVNQRDFEYQSPAPRVVAQGVATDGANATSRMLTLDLNSYWDCVPANVRRSWPDEDPQEAKDGARRLSSLPDPAVVYQLVEEFSGNVEVQLEIALNPKDGGFEFRRLGQKYKPVEAHDLRLPSDSTAPYQLTFTLEAADATEGGTRPQPAVNSVTFSTLGGVPSELPASLQARLEIDRTEGTIHCLGYLSLNDAKTLSGWFADPLDKKKARTLFEEAVRTGAQGRELTVRARRGSAPPVSAQFDVPELPEA